MLCFFFFKQKTAYEMRISDWSSDVCSSDLMGPLSQRAAGDDARGSARRRKGDEIGGAHRPELEARMLPRRRGRAHRQNPRDVGREHGMAVEGRAIADLHRRRRDISSDRPDRSADLLAPRHLDEARAVDRKTIVRGEYVSGSVRHGCWQIMKKTK